METANESGNEKLTSRAKAFVVFEKEFRRFEVQKECDSMRLFITRKLRDLAAEKRRNLQTSKDTNLNLPLILIYIWINEISKERTDCYIIRKLGFYWILSSKQFWLPVISDKGGFIVLSVGKS